MRSLIFIFVLFVSINQAVAKDTSRGYIPPDGFVPDPKTAALVAEAVLVPIYGAETIHEQKPFRINMKKGVWVVEGAFLPAPGGTFEIHISKKTGAILYVMHEK